MKYSECKIGAVVRLSKLTDCEAIESMSNNDIDGGGIGHIVGFELYPEGRSYEGILLVKVQWVLCSDIETHRIESIELLRD